MGIREICREIMENPLDTDFPAAGGMEKLLDAAGSIDRPNIARLSGRTVFSGDIHGDFDSMLAAFRVADEANANIVFLGDVVDRGSHNVECANLLLARMLLEPDRIIYTRGNHEFRGINARFGFGNAVLERYPEAIFHQYNIVFAGLPLAVLQNGKIYGVHGGVSRHLRTLGEIEGLEHRDMNYREENIDLLWNDPATVSQEGFEMNNRRGIFWTFGRDVFDGFMQKNNLELFIRGHNVQKPGYRYFFDNRLISIFTSGDFYTDTKPSVVLVEDDASHEIIGL